MPLVFRVCQFFPPLYSVEQYIAQESTSYDVQSFISLQNHLGRLSISQNHHSWDTATGAWHKWWKYWEVRGTCAFHTVSAEMYILFVCLRSRWAYSGDLGHCWRRGGTKRHCRLFPRGPFLTSKKHRAGYGFRETPVLGALTPIIDATLHAQQLFGWLPQCGHFPNYSMPADRGGFYPVLPHWWDAYEHPYHFFVPALLAFSDYGGFPAQQLWRYTESDYPADCRVLGPCQCHVPLVRRRGGGAGQLCWVVTLWTCKRRYDISFGDPFCKFPQPSRVLQGCVEDANGSCSCRLSISSCDRIWLVLFCWI